MVTIATTISITIPGTHRVTFIPPFVFDQVFFIENMLLVKKETSLILIQPGM